MTAGFAVVAVASTAGAATLGIRPINFGNGMTATGTIDVNDAGAVVDWNLAVSTLERLGHFTPSNAPSKVVSLVSISGDGAGMSVGTSPDSTADGGALVFRSRNPLTDFGTWIANFTDPYAGGGEALYMAGAAFDFLDLNQRPNVEYLVATASPLGGHVFDLVPLTFPGGAALYGTLTTDGSTGPLGSSSITAWDIYVDLLTTDVFNPSNSALAARLVSLGPDGAVLNVTNPDGTLEFIKGVAGGHRYSLQLADFSDQAPLSGQAGYFQGRLAVTTVNLHAGRGPWAVTGASPVGSVPEPSIVALLVAGIAGLAASRGRRV